MRVEMVHARPTLEIAMCKVQHAGVHAASKQDQRAVWWPEDVPDLALAGQPEFALDVDNVKPLGLVIGAAVALLLAGKPLSGSRGFGGLQYGLPKIGDVTGKVTPACMSLRT